MKVNYVIACWTGARRADDRRAARDRTFMIRHHIAALEAANHSLDQITIVLAEGGDAKADEFIKGLKSIGGTPVVVLGRENTGYSYASWNHAFETYKEEFTHYIIVEDDYMPWAHNFDDILVEHANRADTYVCGLEAKRGRLASISNGVIPSKVWSQVHPAPYEPGDTFREGNQSQRIWTEWFSVKGFPVADHLGTHSSPFWLGNSIRWYGDLSKPPLFIPVDVVERDVLVSNIGLAVPIRLGLFGEVIVDRNYSDEWNQMVNASIQGRTK